MLALTLKSLAHTSFEKFEVVPSKDAVGDFETSRAFSRKTYAAKRGDKIPSFKNANVGGRLYWAAECEARAQTRIEYVSEWCANFGPVSNHCWLIIEGGSGELFLVEQEALPGGWAYVQCKMIPEQPPATLTKETDDWPSGDIFSKFYRHEHYVNSAEIGELGVKASGMWDKITNNGGKAFEWFHPAKPKELDGGEHFTLGLVKDISKAFLAHFPKYTLLEHNCQGVHHPHACPLTRPDAMLVTPFLRAEFSNKVSEAITLEIHDENSSNRRAAAKGLITLVDVMTPWPIELMVQHRFGQRPADKIIGALGTDRAMLVGRGYDTPIALERKRRLRRRRSGARRHAKSLHDELKGVLAADAELKSA